MKTLADLKRYLATPEATLQMIAYSSCIRGEWIEATPKNNEARKVGKLQTNSFALIDSNGKKSWLDFGKSSYWSFDGNTVFYSTDYCRITYIMGATNENV